MTHAMTHKNAGFLLAHGRKKSGISRFELPPKGRAKNRLFVLNYDSCHTIRHTGSYLFPVGNVMNSPLGLAVAGKGWQAVFTSSKKMKNRFETRTVHSLHFFSLSDETEKKGPACQLYQVLSPQMAYSLTPYFITLQNEAL
jgi:hypothetical protein